MIVLVRALRDRRRSLLWWSIGIVGLVASTVVLYPAIEANPEVDALVKDLPVAMRSMFGLDGAVPLTSAPGYLWSRMFSALLPLLLLVFAIGAGARAIGGSEEDGELELLLMNPVSRRTTASARYGAVVVMVAFLTLVGLVSVLLLAPPFGALDDVAIGGLLVASAGGGLLALLHGTIAFAVGAATGRRVEAIGVASAVAVAGYLLHGVSTSVSELDPVRAVIPWSWYLERNLLAEGATLRPIVLPLIVSIAVAVPSLPLFARRDLR